MIERLQKYMAECGIASRRKCEEIIQEGRVSVNSLLVKELGFKIDTEKDIVKLDDKQIYQVTNKVYIALNKPTGYISSVSDDKGRSTIIDLVNIKERIFPIGRLDYDSSGLILLTNDGDVYNGLIHPSEEINKVYEALIKGVPSIEEIDKFSEGLDIGDYVTAKAKIEIIKNNGTNSIVRIIIHEGKNRQVRRMCEQINHEVIALKRTMVGDIKLGDLKEGSFRYLSTSEISYLKKL
ncbi:MAG TPA: pseudouridine synthase [Clostridiaceae bacterium]